MDKQFSCDYYRMTGATYKKRYYNFYINVV